MLPTRLETYTVFEEGLPFSFTADIRRGRSFVSPQANRHENPELQAVTGGSGYVLLDGRRIEVSAGDLVAVNPDVIHYTSAEEEITYDCLIVDPLFLREAGFDPALRFEACPRSEALTAQLRQLREAYRRTDDPCRGARLRMLLLGLFIELREHHALPAETPAKGGAAERVWAAVTFIGEHYGEKLTLERIAGQVYTSKYRLSREFRQHTGQTVVEYVNAFRCRKAAQRIRNGSSVSAAALGCGFTNLSYFTRTFKAVYGTLPSKLAERKP